MPSASLPPGWYQTKSDPEGSQRYWDGKFWQAELRWNSSEAVEEATRPAEKVLPVREPTEKPSRPVEKVLPVREPAEKPSRPVEKVLVGEPAEKPSRPVEKVLVGEPAARYLARCIDLIIWAVVFLGSRFCVNGFFHLLFDVTFSGIVGKFITSFFVLLVAGYELLLVHKWGATLGKLVVALKVQTADQQQLSVVRSGIRVAPVVILAILTIVGYLPVVIQLGWAGLLIASFVLVFIDQNRQTVWDRLARTTVVQTRRSKITS